MAVVLTQNAGKLRLGTMDVAADLMSVSIDVQNADVDVTRGNQGHTLLARGIMSTSVKIEIAWTDTNRAQILPLVRPGEIVEMEWGPEGTAAGSPRHVQKIKIAGVSVEQSANYDVVKFSITANGAEAPTVDIFNGGSY